MISRRAVLLSPVALAGCGLTSGGTVRVAVTWSGWELARFRVVLQEFERLHGYTTEVVPLGDDIAAVLGSRRGGAVDVVLLPQIWPLARLWERLEPMDDYAWVFPNTWRTFLTYGGAVRAIPFKVSHKSVVWYRKDLFDQYGEKQPPTTWTDWRVLNQRFADNGIAPLALGGADGWVLADFFENVLHGKDSTTYAELAAGAGDWRSPTVVGTFEALGEMWSPLGFLSGGATGALLTQAEAAVVDHFLPGRAAMIAGADFTYPVIARHNSGLTGQWFDWFPFPTPDGRRRPPKVGADLVVLPAPASQGAFALAGWLAQDEAHRIWARAGGMLSVHSGVGQEAYPTDRLEALARDVRTSTREPVFDLADSPGDPGGVLRRVLWNFLRDVGGNPARVSSAAREAASRMADATGGAR